MFVLFRLCSILCFSFHYLNPMINKRHTRLQTHKHIMSHNKLIDSENPIDSISGVCLTVGPFSCDHCIICPSSCDHCIICPSSCDHCIICPSSCDHCIICPSSIDSFCLPLWCLQTFPEIFL